MTDVPPGVRRDGLKAVLFDVYGTLVGIGAAQGRQPRAGDAALIMGRSVGLVDAADLLGIRLTDAQRAGLEDDLRAEIASIVPFDDALPALLDLKRSGLRVGLCSNLAADYAAPVLAALPVAFDALAWSFAAGAIKPDAAIYAYACRQLGCPPGDVLMVGDTVDADVDEPRAFGMQAVLLDREGRGRTAEAIASLSALCNRLDRTRRQP